MNYFKNLKNTYPPKYINSVINDPMFAKSNTSTYKPIYIEAFNKLFFGKDKGQFKKEISTKYNESGKTLGNTMYYDWIEKYLFLNQYINKNDSQFLAYLLDLISYDVKKDRDAIVRDNNKMTCNDIINNSKPLVSVRLKDLIFTKEECKKIIQLANKDEKLEKDRNSRVQEQKKRKSQNQSRSKNNRSLSRLIDNANENAILPYKSLIPKKQFETTNKIKEEAKILSSNVIYSPELTKDTLNTIPQPVKKTRLQKFENKVRSGLTKIRQRFAKNKKNTPIPDVSPKSNSHSHSRSHNNNIDELQRKKLLNIQNKNQIETEKVMKEVLKQKEKNSRGKRFVNTLKHTGHRIANGARTFRNITKKTLTKFKENTIRRFNEKKVKINEFIEKIKKLIENFKKKSNLEPVSNKYLSEQLSEAAEETAEEIEEQSEEETARVSEPEADAEQEARKDEEKIITAREAAAEAAAAAAKAAAKAEARKEAQAEAKAETEAQREENEAIRKAQAQEPVEETAAPEPEVEPLKEIAAPEINVREPVEETAAPEINVREPVEEIAAPEPEVEPLKEIADAGLEVNVREPVEETADAGPEVNVREPLKEIAAPEPEVNVREPLKEIAAPEVKIRKSPARKVSKIKKVSKPQVSKIKKVSKAQVSTPQVSTSPARKASKIKTVRTLKNIKPQVSKYKEDININSLTNQLARMTVSNISNNHKHQKKSRKSAPHVQLVVPSNNTQRVLKKSGSDTSIYHSSHEIIPP